MTASDFSSQVTFVPFDFTEQPKGETFVAGELFYQNGTTELDTSIDFVDLNIETSSSDPDFTQSLVETLGFIITTNFPTNPPELNADAVYFLDRPELGYFFVNEGESTSIEILTEFNSLDLIGFGNIADPSVGAFSANPTPEPVPEPLTILGTLVAGGMGVVMKKKRG